MKQFDHHIAGYAIHIEWRDAMSSAYPQIYQMRIRARNGQRHQQTTFRINSLTTSVSTEHNRKMYETQEFPVVLCFQFIPQDICFLLSKHDKTWQESVVYNF